MACLCRRAAGGPALVLLTLAGILPSGAWGASAADLHTAAQVHSLRACNHLLPAADRNLLRMRFGLGGTPLHTAAQMAVSDHRTLAQEVSHEQLVIGELQADSARSICGKGGRSKPAASPAATATPGTNAKAPKATTAPAAGRPALTLVRTAAKAPPQPPSPAPHASRWDHTSLIVAGVVAVAALALLAGLVREWRIIRGVHHG